MITTNNVVLGFDDVAISLKVKSKTEASLRFHQLNAHVSELPVIDEMVDYSVPPVTITLGLESAYVLQEQLRKMIRVMEQL